MVSVSHPMASLIEDKTIAGGLDTVKNCLRRKIMYNYSVFVEMLKNEDSVAYTAYGIVVCSMEDNERKEVLKISDVSADKSRVEELVDLCNKEQLEPVHIYDVIEDFLYS